MGMQLNVAPINEFPKSEFFGFDYHADSIDMAREAAQREGVSGRVTLRSLRRKRFRERITTSSRSSIAYTAW